MEHFLAATDVIDFHTPSVAELARELASGAASAQEVIERCFVWVRDEVQHSADFNRDPVTCTASEVFRERTGLCYSKSHLLAALLRANGIPTAFCYQRLNRDGGGSGAYSLHGLNAVWMGTAGWFRLDARGNRPDVDARFTPPVESLAFHPNPGIGEYDLPGFYAEPLPEVIAALRSTTSCALLWDRLPDAPAD